MRRVRAIDFERAQAKAPRFWANVAIGAPTECWEWQSTICSNVGGYGYGHFGMDYQKYKAHRVMYTLVHGAVPEGMLVCHSCDNPKCVNPTHLWPGTASDNRLDSLAKRRAA